MKLKKIASLMLAGIMAVSMLAACGNANSNGGNGGEGEGEVTPTSTTASVLRENLGGEARRNVTAVADSDLDAALKSAVADYCTNNQIKIVVGNFDLVSINTWALGEAVIDDNEDSITKLKNTDGKDVTAIEVFAIDKSVSDNWVLEKLADKINTFCNDDDKDKTQNELIYNLLYKTLENIQNSKDKTQITLNILKFQLHFMNIAGFGIELERCLKCSKTVEGDALFSIQTGGIICPNCDADQVQYVKLHKKIREFLITLSKTPVDKKTFYDDLVNDKITNSCFNLLKKYIEITCNKKSKALKVMEAAKVS